MGVIFSVFNSVSSQSNLGEQLLTDVNALAKRTPLDAKRSMCGVLMAWLPNAEASNPASSATMRRAIQEVAEHCSIAEEVEDAKQSQEGLDMRLIIAARLAKEQIVARKNKSWKVKRQNRTKTRRKIWKGAT